MATITELGYGFVKGRLLAGIGDSSDPDTAPDAVPMQGRVEFTATTPAVRVPTATPAPVTVFPRPISVALDTDGYLIDGQGSKNIALFATDDPDGEPVYWRWKASFFLEYEGRPVPYSSFTFDLPTGATIDLTQVTPLSPIPEPVPGWQVVTQAQYNAINPMPNTVYLVTV